MAREGFVVICKKSKGMAKEEFLVVRIANKALE